ncbi:conserved hypothetical protein [Luminiphilus syltensis NOR5-1B]|uniref:Thioredoxin-like fold domain-containing protein n=2 Tax=Luminiphilus TaxID=1341118 RepID=B8KX41_9GAMM|nr:conserved hypothetical protein [Luminiphilus syltensis NOR5-1B]
MAIDAHSSEAQLLLVFSEQCGACQKFESEVGPIYGKTALAEAMPLTKITIEEWREGHHNLPYEELGPVFGTPTFIQIIDGKEVDRITGYTNDELFWLGVARMENRLGHSP